MCIRDRLYAANTSKLVNIMNKLLELVATTLKDEIDIEILEMHDQWKKDAPSGTSREMGEIMAHALGKEMCIRDRGVYGINGSPSCGVDYTYDGDWGGELGGKDAPCQLDKEYRPGVFMDVFAKLLEERHLSITFYTLDAENRTI